MLVIGAGGLGCELLKDLALSGFGHIDVIDMDTIDISNLNRQFLFRPWDVSKAKAECAAKAIQTMNPACPVAARLDRVGPETENVFDDAFWEGLSGVCNALDNVQARLYVDQRCVYYQKSLLESGTLGTKCHVQSVLPGISEHYGATRLGSAIGAAEVLLAQDEEANARLQEVRARAGRDDRRTAALAVLGPDLRLG